MTWMLGEPQYEPGRRERKLKVRMVAHVFLQRAAAESAPNRRFALCPFPAFAIKTPHSFPMSLYVLILAGGSGERFWPLSRRAKPKQLLALFSDETLLAATLRRLEGLVPPERVLILTNADQEAGVRAI